MLDQFASLGVDPCGERGEYHTAVINSPLFSSPIDVVHGEHVLRSGCHALDPCADLQICIREADSEARLTSPC